MRAPQPDLFSYQPQRRYPASPGHRGVDTSIAAARAIEPDVSRLQRLVLKFLATCPGGAIRNDVMEGTGLQSSTACARLRELEIDKLVIKSPEKRPGPSGKNCRVYKITEAGRAAT